MKKLFFLAWFFCLPILGATGDITGLAIPTNGWQLHIYATSLDTNKLFTLGLSDSNAVPDGDEKIVLVMERPGHNADGSTNVTTVTNYGTARIRFPDPDEAFPDVTIDGSTTLLKVALSKFVCVGDRIASYTIGAGFYDAAGTPNLAAAAGLTVTNNSIVPHPKGIPRWNLPGWDWITNNILTLRLIGGHVSAGNFKPMQSVDFFLKDEAGNTFTTNVAAMTVDTAFGDAVSQPEFIAHIDLLAAGLTHSNLIRSDFLVKGRVGDPASNFDTRLDEYTFPSLYPGSQTNFWCTNLYASIAVVSTTGNDSNGKATNLFGGQYALVNAAHEFATISGAGAAARGTNNSLFGHQTLGGTTIFVKSGIVDSMGGSATLTGVGKAFFRIVEYPGDTVILSTNTGNATFGVERVKVVGIEVQSTGNDIHFSGEDLLVFEDSVLRSAGNGGGCVASCNQVWVVRGSIPQYAPGVHGGSQNMGWFLRGVNLNGLNSIVVPWLLSGVLNTTQNGTGWIVKNDRSTWGAANPEFQVWWYCFLGGFTATASTPVTIAENFDINLGMLVANVVIENSATSMANSIGAANKHTRNCIIWRLVLVGARNQYWYNELGTSPFQRIFCSTRYSIFTVTGEATDFMGTPSGNRVGDWPVRWRVEHDHNIWRQLTGISGVHGDPEFRGLYSYRPETAQATAAGWAQFANDQAFADGGGASGGGDYRLRNSSPIRGTPYRGTGTQTENDQPLPVGLNSVPYSATDGPGAFAGSFPVTILRGSSAAGGIILK